MPALYAARLAISGDARGRLGEKRRPSIGAIIDALTGENFELRAAFSRLAMAHAIAYSRVIARRSLLGQGVS